jgi:tetratricopeptide (TPR) repeat protein
MLCASSLSTPDREDGRVIGRNPYVIGVPLTDAAAFYGRQDFFHFIRDVLDAEQQNVIVLYGQRRIGKTSVLHQAAQWLRDQGGWSPVYFDLQGKERLRLGEVLANLAQTIARRLSLDKPDATLFDEEGHYFSDHFLPQAFSRLEHRRLVLLFDEFDVLGDELASPGAASETLFPYLQDLIATQRTVGFVFVVGRRIEELATHFQAIFKQAVYRRVGHLKPEDSRALILEPAHGTISYSDDAVREIQRLAAGHPYFTQLICFEAFNAVKASGRDVVGVEVIQDVVTRAIESGHGALNWFWEGLPRAERFILSAVAHASDGSGISSNDDVRRLLEENRILLSGLELKDAPDRLVEWEMLRRNGSDTYAFVVELVRRWVIQEHPLSNARRDIDYVSKRAVRLFENAREAHSAGDLPYARDEYLRTLKANPNHSGAQLGLALVLYELGELDESIVEFERAYTIDEMSARDGLIRARLARGETLEKQSLVDQALLEYERVLRLAPAEETALRHVGLIWMARAEQALARGDLGAVRDGCREALQRDHGGELASRVQSALITHAEESTTLGNLEHGSDSYRLLLELLPERVELKTQAAAFWARGGDLFESRGELEAAVDWYLKASALFPDDAVASARLASVQHKLEERQAVGRVFGEALAAHRAGKFDEARDGWKKLIQMDVLSYRGQNIATLLAETIVAPATQPAKAAPGAASPIESDVDDAIDDRKRRTRPRPRKGVAPDDILARPDIADAETDGRADVRPGIKSSENNAIDEEADAAPGERVAVEATDRAGRDSEDAETRPYVPFPESSRLGWIALSAVLGAAMVTFLSWPASVTGIYMGSRPAVKPGAIFQLYPTLFYSSDWRRRTRADASPYAYYWRSSDSTVATVSLGVVTAVGPGTAQITARYGNVEGSMSVVVESMVGLSVPAHMPVKVGASFELRPTAAYAGGARADHDLAPSSYTWTSSNEAIATVAAGTVTARSPGTARITARYGAVENSTEITVLPWDVPGMRAMFNSVKFYSGTDPSLKDPPYKTEFVAPVHVLADFSLAIDFNATERRRSAAFTASFFRNDALVWNNAVDITNVPQEWHSVVQPVRLGDLSPGAYRVEIAHAGKTIGSGKFVVK